MVHISGVYCDNRGVAAGSVLTGLKQDVCGNFMVRGCYALDSGTYISKNAKHVLLLCDEIIEEYKLTRGRVFVGLESVR